jgi:HEAT repeat protein
MLAAMGEGVLQDVKDHLSDDRWYFVRNLVLIIGEVGDSRFIPHLGTTLEHEDSRVRAETVLALMNMQGDTATELLIKATSDPDMEVRLTAVSLLGSSGAGTAKDRLEELLGLSNWRGQNSDTIRTAAIALGQLGDPEPIAVLKAMASARPRLFKSRRMPVVEAATWAVEKLEGGEAGPAPELPQLRGLDAKRTNFIRRQ